MEIGTIEYALLQDHCVGLEDTASIGTEESRTGA